MSEVVEATEESVAANIASSYEAKESPGSASEGSEPAFDYEKFEFDPLFQTQIAALCLRHDDFIRRVGHLLKPEYFEDAAEAWWVNFSIVHFREWKGTAGKAAQVEEVSRMITAGKLKGELRVAVVQKLRDLWAHPLGDVLYAESRIAEFARHQAVSAAILQSVAMLNRKEFGKIEKMIRNAVEVGLNDDGGTVDYWKSIEDRTEERLDIVTGKRPPTGITTGNRELDELLLHKGWGRRELVSIMGGAKSGKTTALINFAKSASVAGYNVKYVTLEVSARIISERLDASLSDTLIKELCSHIRDVEKAIKDIKHGRLDISEFPSGSLTPNALRSMLERDRAKGRSYDLLVVDYADIMAPNFRTQDTIENSKSVYVDLRGIAFEFNCAVVTATQTNREGYKATVAKAEHVAEDFNKVRTVDLMISINATEEERSRGEARLYFAAARNQEGGFTIHIAQNLAKMQFLTKVLRVE